MKKSLLKILIIVMIMILPIYIKAGTYSQEVNNANSYILGNDFRNDYQKYLMDGSKDILSFGYKNGKVERDTNFTYGGFISNDEYKITTKDNVSYLYDGVNYWTLTKDGTKYYVVGESETQDTNKNYRSRVTEYLRSDIKISGQGTLKDPWMFEPIYKVDLKVENGTVEYPNGQYIDRSGKLIANFTPTFGYRYITNDCGIYMENGYDKEKNVATVSRVNRDLTCNVIFGLGIYKVQLGADEEVVKPKNIYLRYEENFYKEESLDNVIREIQEAPTKEGYTFKGYSYTDREGKEVLIISSTGKIDSSKSSTITEDTILTSVWEANKYEITFNANGGTVSPGTKTVTFDDEYGVLPEPKRPGYNFDGWYTASEGGERILSTTKVTTARAQILYAHWTICASGTYTAENSSYCTACPAGSYNTEAGASSCKKCEAGHYCTGGENNSLCPGGTYRTETGATSQEACITCNTGSFSKDGASKCTACEGGTYNTGTGNTSCTKCEAGYSCSGGGNHEKCAVGYHSSEGSSTCTINRVTIRYKVNGGTIKSSTKDSNYSYTWTVDSNGLITRTISGKSSTDYHGVDYGKTVNLANWDNGSYMHISKAGNVAVKGSEWICESGCTVANKTFDHDTTYNASDFCDVSKGDCTVVLKVNWSECPAGTYAAAGETVCTACAAGTYNTTAGQSSCAACPAGKYCTGGTNNTACPAGTYRTGTGGKAVGDCTKCDAGTASNKTGQTAATTCVACTAGTYNTTAGSTSCSACPAGKYCTGGTNNTACPAGTYRTGTGGTAVGDCTKCAAGTASSGTGKTAASTCVACTAGTYNTGEGNTSCTKCEKGYYCTGGSNRTACPAGTYNSGEGGSSAESCTACVAGTYGTKTAQTSSANACTTCEDGYGCSGGSNHTKCAAGTYSTGTGNSSCTTCEKGYYCTGGSNHTACDAGTANNSTGQKAATACVTCAAGTYTSSKGQATCASCPAGKYCTGGTNNTACPAGTYRTGTGGKVAGDCTACAAGTYSTATGQTAASTCVACPAGKYCTGGSNNTACPAGTYKTTTGGKAVGDCTKCAAGTASSGTGQTAATTCVTCPAGTYTSSEGQSTCAACPAGKYCTGGTNTTNCPAGTYRTGTGGKVAGDCTACAAGTYSTATGQTAATTCVACPAGKYCTGGSNNTACPAGTYKTTTGGKAVGDCTKCAAGTASSGTGKTAASTCVACTAGTYTSSEGQSTCSSCPAGKYCTGGSNVTNCPAGTYRTGTGGSKAGDCTKCAAGTASNKTGQTAASTCVACTAGTFAASDGLSVCTKCPDGYDSESGAKACEMAKLTSSNVCCGSSCSLTTGILLSYTGNCQILDDGGNNWRIKLLSNGNLTVAKLIPIDVFLVGGGGGGGCWGGGGGGGYTLTQRNINLEENTTYPVTIGAGGGGGGSWWYAGEEYAGNGAAGGKTTAFGFTANGGGGGIGWGGGGNGGSGGANRYATGGGASDGGSNGGKGQGTTTSEFEEGVYLYAGGGAGWEGTNNSTGGEGGGGNRAAAGGANTGGGGGANGSGGSGVVVIRNIRSSVPVVLPKCKLKIDGSNVVFESKTDKDNNDITTFGISTTNSPVYDGTSSLAGKAGTTFYGFVKDSDGNEGRCSLKVNSCTQYCDYHCYNDLQATWYTYYGWDTSRSPGSANCSYSSSCWAGTYWSACS